MEIGYFPKLFKAHANLDQTGEMSQLINPKS